MCKSFKSLQCGHCKPKCFCPLLIPTFEIIRIFPSRIKHWVSLLILIISYQEIKLDSNFKNAPVKIIIISFFSHYLFFFTLKQNLTYTLQYKVEFFCLSPTSLPFVSFHILLWKSVMKSIQSEPMFQRCQSLEGDLLFSLNNLVGGWEVTMASIFL